MDGGERCLDDKTVVELTKLKYDHDLATLGLQGTLWGAWASLAAIVIIVVVQVMTQRYVLQGKSLAATVGIMAAAVTFYGAFVFNRALSVSAKMPGRTSISAISGEASSTSVGKGHGHGPPEIDKVG